MQIQVIHTQITKITLYFLFIGSISSSDVLLGNCHLFKCLPILSPCVGGPRSESLPIEYFSEILKMIYATIYLWMRHLVAEWLEKLPSKQGVCICSLPAHKDISCYIIIYHSSLNVILYIIYVILLRKSCIHAMVLQSHDGTLLTNPCYYGLGQERQNF